MRIAVAGATGLVGEVLLGLLPQSRFADAEIVALASADSAGRCLPYAGGELTVSELTVDSFKDVDLAFFAIGDELSQRFVPQALDAGARVVDKSNAFRLKEGVPLMVPGVNDEALGDAKLAANPNCTTIGFVHAIAPLARFGIEEVVAATYQAISGAGRDAVSGFWAQTKQALAGEPDAYSTAAAEALRVVPAVDELIGDEHKEETKLRLESAKILGLEDKRIFATAARVPVLTGHSVAAHLKLHDEISEEAVRDALGESPTLQVLPTGETPTSADAVKHRDRVVVGRIRVRPQQRTVDLFAVADNLHIGAALNGLRIGELMI